MAGGRISSLDAGYGIFCLRHADTRAQCQYDRQREHGCQARVHASKNILDVSILGDYITRINIQMPYRRQKMKQLAYLVLVPMLLFSYSGGHTRNTVDRYSIEEALLKGEAELIIKTSVRLFFGDQEYPAVERELHSVTANRKTNAFGKSDKKACIWAFLSAMISLQDQTIDSGGNAVVNIRSFYYKNEFSSATEFECGAGALMAGVTMTGDIVTLAD